MPIETGFVGYCKYSTWAMKLTYIVFPAIRQFYNYAIRQLGVYSYIGEKPQNCLPKIKKATHKPQNCLPKTTLLCTKNHISVYLNHKTVYLHC